MAPFLKIYMLAALLVSSVVSLSSPEGPNQQCRDDAGPPWTDDTENYPSGEQYHTSSPAQPLLPASGECPSPLASACASKGTKAAYIDGPIDCGDRGWFCRIVTQPGWMNGAYPREYGDKNFAHCNATDADERDDDGHCHGSASDDTYGWWIRDHWFRGYAGTLHCCCDWQAVKGVVNRCDYRRHVDPSEVAPVSSSCRDANEDHGLNYEGGCEGYRTTPFVDPLTSGSGQCWSLRNFADEGSVRQGGGGDGNDNGGGGSDATDEGDEGDEGEEGDEHDQSGRDGGLDGNGSGRGGGNATNEGDEGDERGSGNSALLRQILNELGQLRSEIAGVKTELVALQRPPVQWSCALGPEHQNCKCSYQFRDGSHDPSAVDVTCA